MTDPRAVFTDPTAHLALLTATRDADFEGQYFDRKEVCRPNKHGAVSPSELKAFREEHITACVSAFANTNANGGLLVLGIASNGEVKGLAHLTEAQRNQIAAVDDLLVNQTAEVKFHPVRRADGSDDALCLVFVPYTARAICETHGRNARAWRRQGPQNLPLTDQLREQIKRDKHVVDFERTPCTPFAVEDVDEGVLKEFESGQLSHYQRSADRVLYDAGAVVRESASSYAAGHTAGHPAGSAAKGYALTNAGTLFFTVNPQRVLSYARVRLLRFNVPVAQRDQPGLPDFDRELTGPLTKQIRDFRAFVETSGFFKVYQRRNQDGGFTDEPELPFIAIDEALVNAVAHRDYAIRQPIRCEKYTDAFVVQSPGRLLQRTDDVPPHFDLEQTHLEHYTRNPMLVAWLKNMRDARGAPYVRALQEGTRRMRDEMAQLGLPAPAYTVDAVRTTLTLYSNAPAREASIRASDAVQVSEFANLYPLDVEAIRPTPGGAEARADQRRTVSVAEGIGRRRDILDALKNRLIASGWYVDSVVHGVLMAHRRGSPLPAPNEVRRVVQLFPAYAFQVREHWGRSYLCVDYTLTVQSVMPVSELLVAGIPAADLAGLRTIGRVSGAWQRGKLLGVDGEWCRVFLFEVEREERIATARVVPRLPRMLIEQLLSALRVRYDLPAEIKRASLSVQAKAARVRADKTQATVHEVAADAFPLIIGDTVVRLSETPVALRMRDEPGVALPLDWLEEPAVEFNRQHVISDIREGITRFGAYDSVPRDIELVPVCAAPHRDRMAGLIDRLRGGKFKYRGAERTFSARLTYYSIVTTPSEDVTSEVERMVVQHPEWCGDPGLPRLFLVHCPERGYALDDENSPYYRIKRLLLGRGIPCQMVDTPTLANPDYKDLNLALNVAAKVGITPWVLPESIPDADFFVGLSYTQSTRSEGERLMGFANVFNEYGRWEFYSGSSEAFPYHERAAHYESLIGETMRRLNSKLSETPRVYFHYSAKFSHEDREAILRAARLVRPRGTYAFVWINTHHHVRLYDSRPEGDGSLRRGSYVRGAANQIYLSTTGFNPYRSVLGTPHALEVNVRTTPPEGTARSDPDLRALAAQVLSLTKLNWASTDSLCAEPITIKYAGDIAYLTSAFLRQDERETFRLHPVLEHTPWFI